VHGFLFEESEKGVLQGHGGERAPLCSSDYMCVISTHVI
jgi:hypothetical protein